MATDAEEIVHEVKENPWLLGLIYYNSGDQRLVVRQRTGLGWTLNMAKPKAWLILSPFILLLIWNLTHKSEKQ